MADDISALKRLLENAVQGVKITDEEVRSVQFSSNDPAISRAANDAWLAVRRFVDDEDIRSRDRAYEWNLQSGLNARLKELEALQRGEDPR